MVAIITGDIVNSRAVDPKKWMIKLKETLKTVGNEPKDWEIYRGDSFQLRVSPEQALNVAIRIKSTVRQFKELDVRMAIGIGEIDYEGVKITESNGTAFVRSGDGFESLKKETLVFSSPNTQFDKTINTMLSLASLTMDGWTPSASEIIQASLENPNSKQTELAKMLNKPQSNISIGLKRGGFDEIQRLMEYYQKEISTIC